MFNERQRPFFQSAFDYPLKPLPKEELTDFLAKQFTDNGAACPRDVALHLAELIDCYPYYAQKFAHHVYELADSRVSMAEIKMAMRSLIFSEATAFEYAIQGLAPQQRLLLRAIAREPARQIMATNTCERTTWDRSMPYGIRSNNCWTTLKKTRITSGM